MPIDRIQATPAFSAVSRNVWLVFPWGQLILFLCSSRAGERTLLSPANYVEMCFIQEQGWEALSCRCDSATTRVVTDVEQVVITALAGDISAPGLWISTECSFPSLPPLLFRVLECGTSTTCRRRRRWLCV